MPLIPDLPDSACVLICGASQGIGLALCSQLLLRDDVAQVWAVSRQATLSAELAALAEKHDRRLIRIDCDARDEQALQRLANDIAVDCSHLHLVISTLGVLQDRKSVV